jgi:hypothetical protein
MASKYKLDRAVAWFGVQHPYTAEGIICLIMAAPIGLGLSLFGGIVG